MRKSVVYVGAWFLAGAVAVGLASMGVALVSDRVTEERRAPLSDAEMREELAADDLPGAATTTTTTGAPSTTTTAPGPVTPTTVAPVSNGPGGPTGGTTTTAPSTPPPAPVTRTYDLVGGTVTLRFEPTGVTVLVATPEPGFSVEVDEEVHDGGARVEFESDDHRSRVDGWWDGGPRDEVREEQDD